MNIENTIYYKNIYKFKLKKLINDISKVEK